MTPSVDSQIAEMEEYLGQIRSHRRRAITLAAQMMNGVEQLKHVGCYLPDELLQEHNDWRDTWIALRARGCETSAFEGFLPENAAEVDMCHWERALKKGLEVCQHRREEQSHERRQALSHLEDILSLTTTGDPQPLLRLQERARDLKARLVDGVSLTSEEVQTYRTCWELVVDAREGRVDEPESLQRAVQVNEVFDLFLTLQIVRGQIVLPASEAAPDSVEVPVSVAPTAPARRLSLVPSIKPQRTESAAPRLDVSTRPDVVSLAVKDRRERQILESIRDAARKHDRQGAQEGRGDVAAAANDCLAAAADYVLEGLKELPADQPAWEQHLHTGQQFLARSMAAVRSTSSGEANTNPEQLQVLRWLQGLLPDQETGSERLFTLAEKVDLVHVQHLKKEIDEQLHDLRQPHRVKKVLDRIQRRLSTDVLNSEQDLERWQRIVSDVDELIQDEHLAPCNPELREVLADSVDRMPVGLLESRSMRKVLAAIARHMADREADEALGKQPERSPAVRRVAKLLAGQKIVLIGGVPRPRNHEWLRDSLGLAELVWETIGEHEATQKLQPVVQASDVTLVVAMVRWVGHGHADDVRAYCQQVRRPFVSVVRGYQLEQLAQEILQQRGEELQTRLNS